MPTWGEACVLNAYGRKTVFFSSLASCIPGTTYDKMSIKDHLIKVLLCGHQTNYIPGIVDNHIIAPMLIIFRTEWYEKYFNLKKLTPSRPLEQAVCM